MSEPRAHLRRERVAAVVLAAGASARMGQPKALLPFGGRPMVARVVEAIVGAGIGPPVVVTGNAAAQVAAAVEPLGAACVHNAEFAAGEMLSSVRCGVAAVTAKGEAGGILLALGDQPAVKPETIGRLVAAFAGSGAPMVIPLYRAKRGHPLILASSLAPEIAALRADQTLRDLVHRHLETAVQLAVEDPAVVADVDTPEDYRRALAQWNEQEKGAR